MTKHKRVRVPPLKFNKGSLGMFSICEINEKYLIVNHTRNMKGYVPLGNISSTQFSIGQLVIASVVSAGTSTQTSSGVSNKKLQLLIEPKEVNKNLSKDSIYAGMVLPAFVKSQEGKGYILELGLKDKSMGFYKSKQSLNLGEMIYVSVTEKTR